MGIRQNPLRGRRQVVHDHGPGQALALGLVQDVAPANQPFAAWVAEWVDRLARRPARVLRAQKALAAAARREFHARLAPVEAAGFATAWLHADHWDAAAAALDPARRRT